MPNSVIFHNCIPRLLTNTETMSTGVIKMSNHQAINKKRKSCFEITNVAFQSQSDDDSGDENNLSSSYTDFEDDKEDSNGFNCSMIVAEKVNNLVPMSMSNNTQIKSRFKIFKSKITKGRWKCFDFADNESFHASYSIANFDLTNNSTILKSNELVKSANDCSLELLSTSSSNIATKSIPSICSYSKLTTCMSSSQSTSLLNSNDYKMMNGIKNAVNGINLVDHSNNGLNYPNPSYQLLHPIMDETINVQQNGLNSNLVNLQSSPQPLQPKINETSLQNPPILNGNHDDGAGLHQVNSTDGPLNNFALPLQIPNLKPMNIEAPLSSNHIPDIQSDPHVSGFNGYISIDSPVHYEISEKISQALDLAKEHLIIATNKTIETLRLKITSLQSTVQLLEEENRQLRNCNNLTNMHQQQLPQQPMTSVIISHNVPIGDLIDLSDF